MVEEIRSAFKNNLPDLDWMDDETRIAAKDKVRYQIKRAAGQPKTTSSLNRTELKTVQDRGTFQRTFSGRGILFWVGPGRGIFYQVQDIFSPGFRG